MATRVLSPRGRGHAEGSRPARLWRSATRSWRRSGRFARQPLGGQGAFLQRLGLLGEHALGGEGVAGGAAKAEGAAVLNFPERGVALGADQ